MAKNYILVTVSGPDNPGITAALMGAIARSKYEVEDMGQSVTHGLLSLSILINSDQQADQGPVLKELLFEAKKLKLDLDFKIVENGDHAKPESQIFILSCVAVGTITASFIEDLATKLAENDINIQRIDNTTKIFNSVEITTYSDPKLDWRPIKQAIIEISSKHKTDVAFLRDDVYRRSKRLIVFDMDSTLIQTEVIDEMAQAHGVGDEIKQITEQAMNGEIDFEQSLRERVAKLKGLKVEQLENIAKSLPMTAGVEDFVATVKKLGYKVAVISGGFTFFTDKIKEKLSLDYSFSNQLEVIDGALSGKLSGAIITPNQKAILLDLIAQQENISLEQVVAIGDGANDLPMLAKAGLGIAFHAKDIVRKNAQQYMGHGPMTSILYFLGIPGPSALQQ